MPKRRKILLGFFLVTLIAFVAFHAWNRTWERPPEADPAMVDAAMRRSSQVDAPQSHPRSQKPAQPRKPVKPTPAGR